MAYFSGLILVALMTQSPSKSAQAKFDRTCENIVINNLDASSIEREFDLNRIDVSAFMVIKMNTIAHRGENTTPTTDILRHLTIANPGKTVEWILNNYGQFSAIGIANMADSLRHVDNLESYQLLFMLLGDKREVVDERAAIMAPRPYWPYRICDYAYKSIGFMLYYQNKLPPGVPYGYYSGIPIIERDQYIKILLDWWAKESLVFLQKKIPLAATHPSLQNKVEKVLHSNSAQRGIRQK